MSLHAAAATRQPTEHGLRRREAAVAAAAGLALAGWGGAHAQQRGNVREFAGTVLLNGQRLQPQQTVQTGDLVETSPGARVLFVIGDTAVLVRQNAHLSIGRGTTLNAVSELRLLAGALVCAFGPGARRAISTPTLSAIFDGAGGAYAEVMDDQGGRTYFCNAYGQAEVYRGPEKVASSAAYHQCFWGEPVARNGRHIRPASAFNHSDEDFERLARLVGQRTAWQTALRKGARDGKGLLDGQPDQPHPAMVMPPVR